MVGEPTETGHQKDTAMGIGIALSITGIALAATVNGLARANMRAEAARTIIPGKHWNAVDFMAWKE